MVSVLRSLAFYMAFYGGTAVLVLLALLALLIGHGPFRVIVQAWSRYHRFCAAVILGIRFRAEGQIPGGPVLVALKHESFYEAIDLPGLLERPGVFAKAELVRIPLWGTVGRIFGLIPVERDQGARALRAMVAAAKVISAEGRPLAIFPEGTRIRHGRRAPLQAGFAGLYKLLGLPVVPVAIDSGRLYQHRWKRPGTITFRFGETIPPGLKREEIEARVLAAINELNPVDAA